MLLNIIQILVEFLPFNKLVLPPQGSEEFPTFPETFLFLVSCLEFQLYGRRFVPGMVYDLPPRGYFFISPGMLAQR